MTCPSCGPAIAEHRRLEIISGIVLAQRVDPVSPKLMTITDACSTPLSRREFQNRVARLFHNLRSDGRGWRGHYSILSFNPRTDRLHRHLVVLGWEEVPHDRLLVHQRRARLGRIHVETIGPTPGDAARVATYVVFAPGNGFHFARENPEIQTYSQRGWRR